MLYDNPPMLQCNKILGVIDHANPKFSPIELLLYSEVVVVIAVFVATTVVDCSLVHFEPFIEYPSCRKG